MTETIRVRDEDYRRVQYVSEVTGLSSAEALHYLLKTGACEAGQFDDIDDQLREQLHEDLFSAVSVHPRWDDEMSDEAKRELARSAEFRKAEELFSVQHSDGLLTMPSFYEQEQ